MPNSAASGSPPRTRKRKSVEEKAKKRTHKDGTFSETADSCSCTSPQCEPVAKLAKVVDLALKGPAPYSDEAAALIERDSVDYGGKKITIEDAKAGKYKVQEKFDQIKGKGKQIVQKRDAKSREMILGFLEMFQSDPQLRTPSPSDLEDEYLEGDFSAVEVGARGSASSSGQVSPPRSPSASNLQSLGEPSEPSSSKSTSASASPAYQPSFDRQLRSADQSQRSSRDSSPEIVYDRNNESPSVFRTKAPPNSSLRFAPSVTSQSSLGNGGSQSVALSRGFPSTSSGLAKATPSPNAQLQRGKSLAASLVEEADVGIAPSSSTTSDASVQVCYENGTLQQTGMNPASGDKNEPQVKREMFNDPFFGPQPPATATVKTEPVNPVHINPNPNRHMFLNIGDDNDESWRFHNKADRDAKQRLKSSNHQEFDQDLCIVAPAQSNTTHDGRAVLARPEAAAVLQKSGTAFVKTHFASELHVFTLDGEFVPASLVFPPVEMKFVESLREMVLKWPNYDAQQRAEYLAKNVGVCSSRVAPGRGVFASRDLPKRTIVGAFAGVISKEGSPGAPSRDLGAEFSELARLNPSLSSSAHALFGRYAFELPLGGAHSGEILLFSMLNKGNALSLLNADRPPGASGPTLKANCEALTLRLGDKCPLTVVVTLEDVSQDDELILDISNLYFRQLQSIGSYTSPKEVSADMLLPQSDLTFMDKFTVNAFHLAADFKQPVLWNYPLRNVKEVPQVWDRLCEECLEKFQYTNDRASVLLEDLRASQLACGGCKEVACQQQLKRWFTYAQQRASMAFQDQFLGGLPFYQTPPQFVGTGINFPPLIVNGGQQYQLRSSNLLGMSRNNLFPTPTVAVGQSSHFPVVGLTREIEGEPSFNRASISRFCDQEPISSAMDHNDGGVISSDLQPLDLRVNVRLTSFHSPNLEPSTSSGALPVRRLPSIEIIGESRPNGESDEVQVISDVSNDTDGEGSPSLSKMKAIAAGRRFERSRMSSKNRRNQEQMPTLNNRSNELNSAKYRNSPTQHFASYSQSTTVNGHSLRATVKSESNALEQNFEEEELKRYRPLLQSQNILEENDDDVVMIGEPSLSMSTSASPAYQPCFDRQTSQRSSQASSPEIVYDRNPSPSVFRTKASVNSSLRFAPSVTGQSSLGNGRSPSMALIRSAPSTSSGLAKATPSPYAQLQRGKSFAASLVEEADVGNTPSVSQLRPAVQRENSSSTTSDASVQVGYQNDLSFGCAQCGKLLTTKEGLKKHIRAMHQKMLPFVCSVCAWAVFLKENLVRHLRVHTGQKLYECNACGKGFTWSHRCKM